jgi:hypothetical protein
MTFDKRQATRDKRQETRVAQIIQHGLYLIINES